MNNMNNMKNQLIFLALILSVLFNVFFVVGYVQARRTRAVGDVTGRVVNELGLDTAQSKLFAELRSRDREDAEVYQDSLTLVRQELVEELNRLESNPQRLVGIIDQEAELHRQRRLAEAGSLNDFVASLTPDQRRKLMKRLSGATMHERRREEMLRRFDADGDGKIDEHERLAAREFMQTRRAQHEQRWGRPPGERGNRRGDPRARENRMKMELWKRFDADGDGRLDVDERQTMMQWILSQNPPGS